MLDPAVVLFLSTVLFGIGVNLCTRAWFAVFISAFDQMRLVTLGSILMFIGVAVLFLWG